MTLQLPKPIQNINTLLCIIPFVQQKEKCKLIHDCKFITDFKLLIHNYNIFLQDGSDEEPEEVIINKAPISEKGIFSTSSKCGQTLS